MGLELGFRELGEVPYEPTWHAMQRFVAERDKSVMDEAWLLQHPAVFTQGQAGKAEHVLFPGDIPVIQVDRGGQVTYHGPGQLVTYLLLDVRRLGLGVRELVSRIEQSLIGLLASYDVQAVAKPDAPGVYVDGAKIASLGLRIRNGCSFHGLALNLDMDLRPFNESILRLRRDAHDNCATWLGRWILPRCVPDCALSSSHALATLNRRPLRAGSN